MPQVSVILTTYNRPARFIKEAIESIIGQTFTDWELIIVDDGSDDETAANIANEYKQKDSRVRFIRRENGGLSAARNTGLENANGEFIFLQDDDDISLPLRLEKGVDILIKYPDLCGFQPRFQTIDDEGKIIGECLNYCGTTSHKIVNPILPLNQWHVLLLMSSPFRKSALLSVGGYRQFFKMCESVDLTLRLQEKYAIGYFSDYLYQYRQFHKGEQLTRHPMMGLYHICAVVSAYCRRNNMPCPIEQKKDILDIVSMAPPMFDSFPPKFRNGKFYHQVAKYYKKNIMKTTSEQHKNKLLKEFKDLLSSCGKNQIGIMQRVILLKLSILAENFKKK